MTTSLQQVHRRHAVRMLAGGLVIAEAVATRHGQRSIAGLAAKAKKWAVEVRELLEEIAGDASTGRMEVRELLGDGDASPADIKQLDTRFAQIQTAALQGRVVS